jgi:hypothetical protein
MIREMLAEFGYEAPPITDTTWPLFRQLGDIELAIRRLVERWVEQRIVRQADVLQAVAGRDRHLSSDTTLQKAWTLATFSDYWAMLKRGWKELEPYLHDRVPNGANSKEWGRIVFLELRDIRNRVAHHYPVPNPERAIQRDWEYLDREATYVLDALVSATGRP